MIAFWANLVNPACMNILVYIKIATYDSKYLHQKILNLTGYRAYNSYV